MSAKMFCMCKNYVCSWYGILCRVICPRSKLSLECSGCSAPRQHAIEGKLLLHSYWDHERVTIKLKSTASPVHVYRCQLYILCIHINKSILLRPWQQPLASFPQFNNATEVYLICGLYQVSKYTFIRDNWGEIYSHTRFGKFAQVVKHQLYSPII